MLINHVRCEDGWELTPPKKFKVVYMCISLDKYDINNLFITVSTDSLVVERSKGAILYYTKPRELCKVAERNDRTPKKPKISKQLP